MPKREHEEEAKLRLRLVGRQLQVWRQRARLTQWHVADALSYTSSQFVSNWERGVSLPPLDALPVLAKLFRVSPKELIEVMTAYQMELLQLNRRRMARVFKTGAK